MEPHPPLDRSARAVGIALMVGGVVGLLGALTLILGTNVCRPPISPESRLELLLLASVVPASLIVAGRAMLRRGSPG